MQTPRSLHVEQAGALRLTSRSTLLARKGKTLTGRAVLRAATASMVFSSNAFRLFCCPLFGRRGERADDFLDLPEVRALVQKPASAGVEAQAAVLRVRVICEYDKHGARRLRAHGPQHIDAGAADQLVVEHHTIRSGLQDPCDGVGRRIRNADDSRAIRLVHQLDQAVAYRG